MDFEPAETLARSLGTFLLENKTLPFQYQCKARRAIARNHRCQKRFVEAEAVFVRLIQEVNRRRPHSLDERYITKREMACFLMSQGQYAEAKDVLQDILEELEGSDLRNSSKLARCKGQPAKLDLDAGKVDLNAARHLMEDDLRPGASQVRNDVIAELESRDLLTRVYRQEGKLTSAVSMSEAACDLYLKAYRPAREETIDCQVGLADLYAQLRMYGKSEGILVEAFSMAKQYFGHGSKVACVTESALGRLYLDARQLELARTHCLHALAIDTQQQGNNAWLGEPKTLWDLGQIFEAMDDYRQAQATFAQAAELLAKDYGPSGSWSLKIAAKAAEVEGLIARTPSGGASSSLMLLLCTRIAEAVMLMWLAQYIPHMGGLLTGNLCHDQR